MDYKKVVVLGDIPEKSSIIFRYINNRNPNVFSLSLFGYGILGGVLSVIHWIFPIINCPYLP